MEKPIIIVNVGRETHIIYDGKAYGNNISQFAFSHNAGEKARIEMKVEMEGMNLEGIGEPMDSTKDFIMKVLDENSHNYLKDIQDAVSKSLDKEEEGNKLSLKIKDFEKAMKDFRESEGMAERHKGVTTLQYVNSAVVQVSFGIYECDWYLLQQTKMWHRFCDFLEETQNRSSQMSLQEKIDLLGVKEIL